MAPHGESGDSRTAAARRRLTLAMASSPSESPERRVCFEAYEDGERAQISRQCDEETGEWVNAVKLHAVPASCDDSK